MNVRWADCAPHKGWAKAVITSEALNSARIVSRVKQEDDVTLRGGGNLGARVNVLIAPAAGGL